MLTLIFRMWLGAWVCLFCTSRRLIRRKWPVTYQCWYFTIHSSISECDHKCETWNAEPKIGTNGSSQTRGNPRVDGYGSAFGLPRVSRSGFWPGLEPNRPVFVVRTRTAGGFPGPVANTRNAYISCLQPLKRKNSCKTHQLEESSEIDLFDLPQEDIHIEEIDTVSSGMDESMDHGHTRSTSRTEERMSHGRTEDARRIDNHNPAAWPNSELSLTGHTNGHQDPRPPDTGEIDGHHIYTAPDEDADICTEGQSGHCPTLKSHTKVPRDKVNTNRNTWRQLCRVAAPTKKATKKEKTAQVPTDRVTWSAGRARVNITEQIYTVLALTPMNDDPRTYKKVMLSPHRRNEKLWSWMNTTLSYEMRRSHQHKHNSEISQLDLNLCSRLRWTPMAQHGTQPGSGSEDKNEWTMVRRMHRSAHILPFDC